MAKLNTGNLGNKVTFSSRSWEQMVERAWGAEWASPDHGVYVMSNGRKFDSTDQNSTGIYNGGVSNTDYLLLDSAYSDMTGTDHLLQDNYGRIIRNE